MKINKIITRFIIFNICISLFILFTADYIIPFHNIETYTYENNQIIVHSLSEYFEIFLNILFLVISICTAVFIVIEIRNRIKHKEKFVRKVILLIISWFIALILFFFSDIMAAGLWNKEDYSPECYYFTNEDRAIVIEEGSFMLNGWAEIYQIINNNEALIIGHISTDDGYRNKGNYDIKWNENNLEISYHYGDLENRLLTEKIEYAE